MNTDPKIISTLTVHFAEHPAIKKAVLFGSRARGDHTERSDYDIAVYGDLSHAERSQLRYICDEELPTLHKIDLIFMQEQSPSKFTENIEKEGIEIYGKK